MADYSTLFTLGAALILVGVFVLIAAIILMGTKRSQQGKTRTAGVIIVGPVPIIFGNDKEALKTVLTLAIILTVLVIAATIIYYTFLLR